MLTQSRLKELLHYNPDTGVFVNKTNRSPNARKGGISGCKDKSHGYISMSIGNKKYYAHRLAWLYVHGFMPECETDHIDGNRSNNCIKNLREISHQCNLKNCKVQKNNKSGITGVFFGKREQKWFASIMNNYKTVYLGSSKNKTNAVKIRWEGEKKYNYPDCCTTSSSYNYLKERNLI